MVAGGLVKEFTDMPLDIVERGELLGEVDEGAPSEPVLDGPKISASYPPSYRCFLVEGRMFFSVKSIEELADIIKFA